MIVPADLWSKHFWCQPTWGTNCTLKTSCWGTLGSWNQPSWETDRAGDDLNGRACRCKDHYNTINADPSLKGPNTFCQHVCWGPILMTQPRRAPVGLRHSWCKRYSGCGTATKRLSLVVAQPGQTPCWLWHTSTGPCPSVTKPVLALD